VRNMNENIKIVNFVAKPYSLQLQSRLWRNAEHVADFFQIKHITKEVHKKWLDSLTKEPAENIAFFIEVDGLVVGVTYFHSIDRSAGKGDWGIYLHERNYRGSGIGRAALQQCIDVAKNQIGLKYIFLEVFSSNQRAVKLYSSMGFEVLTKNSKKTNILRMKKLLS